MFYLPRSFLAHARNLLFSCRLVPQNVQALRLEARLIAPLTMRICFYWTKPQCPPRITQGTALLQPSPGARSSSECAKFHVTVDFGPYSSHSFDASQNKYSSYTCHDLM